MLIEILVGVERLEEAEKIRARALEILNVAELQSAVSDAEEKIRARHAALAPIPPRAAELVAAWNAHADAFAQKHDMSDTNVQAALQRELAPLGAEIEALLVGTIAEPLVRRQRLLMAELRQASDAEDYARIQEAGERLKATSDEIGKMMKAAGNSLKTNPVVNRGNSAAAGHGSATNGAAHLPANSMQAVKEAASVEIIIPAKGALLVAGAPCPADDLAARLSTLTDKQPVAVVIRSDASVPFKQIVAVMDACKAAGITSITAGTAKAHGSDVGNTTEESSPKDSGRTKIDD
jgi:hypothetical protein